VAPGPGGCVVHHAVARATDLLHILLRALGAQRQRTIFTNVLELFPAAEGAEVAGADPVILVGGVEVEAVAVVALEAVRAIRIPAPLALHQVPPVLAEKACIV